MKTNLGNSNEHCTNAGSCDSGCGAITAEVDKSMCFTRTNTLHQFDTVGVVGVEFPVGKVPILFYVKKSSRTGVKGLLYYDDLDSVCWMYPETEHAEWCKQPYDMRYSGIEDFENKMDDGTVESGKRWNHGIFQLWVSQYRKWHNGNVMYRACKKIQGCGNCDEGYPTQTVQTVQTVEEKTKPRRATPKRKINHSCGCRKG